MYVQKLKTIQLKFRVPTSQINKSLSLAPISPQDIINKLKVNLGIQVKEEDMGLNAEIDVMGGHTIPVKFWN